MSASTAPPTPPTTTLPALNVPPAEARSPSFTPISPDGYRPAHEVPSPIALAPLARPIPLKLRTERPDDRADPRGTHSHSKSHFGDDGHNIHIHGCKSQYNNHHLLPRPRRHLRTRSYNDAELRPTPVALAEGPVTLAPEALRKHGVSVSVSSSRAFSPSDSFGSAVTPPPIGMMPNTRSIASSSASEWSAEDEASARAHVLSTVASATGTDASSMDMLSSRSASPASAVDANGNGNANRKNSNRPRSVGTGWSRNTTRALSSLNGAGSINILRKSASKHASTNSHKQQQSQSHAQLKHSSSSGTGMSIFRRPEEWKSHPNLNGNGNIGANGSSNTRCTCSDYQRSGTWTAINRNDKTWNSSSNNMNMNNMRSCDACRSDAGGRTAFRSTTATAPNPYRNSYNNSPGNFSQDSKNIFRFLKKRFGRKMRK